MESHAQRLEQLETVMDRYFRGPSAAESQAELNRLIDEHNAWTKSAKAKHEQARQSLERQHEALNALKMQIHDSEEALKRKPDATDGDAVSAYNEHVDSRNKLVARYNKLAKKCQSEQEAYNAAVEQFQAEMTERAGMLDEQKESLQAEDEARRQWLQNKEDLAFFKDVNTLYAELADSRGSADGERIKELRSRVEAVRTDLGDYAAQRAKQSANGLILVKAILCGREESCYIVDTGATTVTIPPSLVDVLGLSACLGEEIQVGLAGGITVRARELTIPRMSVFGLEARDVNAVVLDEPEVGVDGLLGLSFLNQFAYRIDKNAPDRLILETRATDGGE